MNSHSHNDAVLPILRPFVHSLDERGKSIFHIDRYHFDSDAGTRMTINQVLETIRSEKHSFYLFGDLVAKNQLSRKAIRTSDICDYHFHVNNDVLELWFCDENKAFKICRPLYYEDYEMLLDFDKILRGCFEVSSAKWFTVPEQDSRVCYGTTNSNHRIKMVPDDVKLNIASWDEWKVDYQYHVKSKTYGFTIKSFHNKSVKEFVKEAYDWPNEEEELSWRVIADYLITYNGELMSIPSFSTLASSDLKFTITGKLLPSPNQSSSRSSIPLPINVSVEVDKLYIEWDIADRGFWVANVGDPDVRYKLYGPPCEEYAPFVDEANNMFRLYDSMHLLGEQNLVTGKFTVRESITAAHTVSDGAVDLSFIAQNKEFVLAYIREFIDLRCSKTFAQSVKDLVSVDPVAKKRLRPVEADDHEEESEFDAHINSIKKRVLDSYQETLDDAALSNASEGFNYAGGTSLTTQIPPTCADNSCPITVPVPDSTMSPRTTSAGTSDNISVDTVSASQSESASPRLSAAIQTASGSNSSKSDWTQAFAAIAPSKMTELLRREDERLEQITQKSKVDQISLLKALSMPSPQLIFQSAVGTPKVMFRDAFCKSRKHQDDDDSDIAAEQTQYSKIRFSSEVVGDGEAIVSKRVKGILKNSSLCTVAARIEEPLIEKSELNNSWDEAEEEDLSGPTAFDDLMATIDRQGNDEGAQISESSTTSAQLQTDEVMEAGTNAMIEGILIDEMLAGISDADTRNDTRSMAAVMVPAQSSGITSEKTSSPLKCTLCNRVGHMPSQCLVTLFKETVSNLRTYHDLFVERQTPDIYCINCDVSGHHSARCREPRAKCTNCDKGGHQTVYCGRVQFTAQSKLSLGYDYIKRCCESLKNSRSYMSMVVPSGLIASIMELKFCINCDASGHNYWTCTSEVRQCSYCHRLNHLEVYCLAKDLNSHKTRFGRVCINCDLNNHYSGDCRFPKHSCSQCRQNGHLSKYCNITQYTILSSLARQKYSSSLPQMGEVDAEALEDAPIIDMACVTTAAIISNNTTENEVNSHSAEQQTGVVEDVPGTLGQSSSHVDAINENQCNGTVVVESATDVTDSENVNNSSDQVSVAQVETDLATTSAEVPTDNPIIHIDNTEMVDTSFVHSPYIAERVSIVFPTSAVVECWICGRKGHSKPDCPVTIAKKFSEVTTLRDLFMSRTNLEFYCINCCTSGHLNSHCTGPLMHCTRCKKMGHVSLYCDLDQGIDLEVHIKKYLEDQKQTLGYRTSLASKELLSRINSLNFCTNCGKGGHNYRECSSMVFTCGFCGRPHHFFYYCWADQTNQDKGRKCIEICINCDKDNHKRPQCSRPLQKCSMCSQLGHHTKYCDVVQYSQLNRYALLHALKSPKAFNNSEVAVERPKLTKPKNGCCTCGRSHDVSCCLVRRFFNKIKKENSEHPCLMSYSTGESYCINCNNRGHTVYECCDEYVFCSLCGNSGHIDRFCNDIQDLAVKYGNRPEFLMCLEKLVRICLEE